MALSDCAKCWDTPCECGWDMRRAPIEYLENRLRMFQEIIKFKKENPKAEFSGLFGDPETEDDKKFMRHMNEFHRMERERLQK